MALYLVLLCYQSVRSNPDGSCTAIDLTSVKEQQSSVIVNSLVAAITITWTGWQTSSTDTHIFSLEPTRRRSDSEDEEKDADLESIGITAARLRKHRKANNAEDDKGVPDYQFHLLMVLASLYMAMVLTNWGSTNGYVATSLKMNRSITELSCFSSSSTTDAAISMWVKISSQWATIGLYIWTLAAPSLFPDRNFGR